MCIRDSPWPCAARRPDGRHRSHAAERKPVHWSRLPSDLTTLTLNEAALHRKLVHSQTQCLSSDILGNTRELEQHATRLDVGDPPLRRTLSGTHAGLGGLLGQRTVWVDVDPDLAATLHVAGHRNTRGLDLTVGDVGRLKSLDAEVTESDLGAARGSARATRVVLLAVLDPTRNQHQASAPSATAGAADSGAVVGTDSATATEGAAASSACGARAGRAPRAGRSGPSRRGPRWGRAGAAACSRANSLVV